MRCLLVWACVTAATGALAPLGGDALARLTTGPPAAFEDLLASVAASALLPALGWLWITTTWTVADVLRGAELRGPAGLTRRLVLVACGIATVAVTPGAHAADRPPPGTVPGAALAGLPLPDRASSAERGAASAAQPLRDRHAGSGERDRSRAPGASAQSPARAPAPRHAWGAPGTHVVAPGDSLWLIAEGLLPPGSPEGRVDALWRRIARANSAAVGADPDVIHPGLALRVPRPRGAR